MYIINDGEYQSDNYSDLISLLAENNLTIIKKFEINNIEQSKNEIRSLILKIEEQMKQNEYDYNDGISIITSAKQSLNYL